MYVPRNSAKSITTSECTGSDLYECARVGWRSHHHESNKQTTHSCFPRGRVGRSHTLNTSLFDSLGVPARGKTHYCTSVCKNKKQIICGGEPIGKAPDQPGFPFHVWIRGGDPSETRPKVSHSIPLSHSLHALSSAYEPCRWRKIRQACVSGRQRGEGGAHG